MKFVITKAPPTQAEIDEEKTRIARMITTLKRRQALAIVCGTAICVVALIWIGVTQGVSAVAVVVAAVAVVAVASVGAASVGAASVGVSAAVGVTVGVGVGAITGVGAIAAVAVCAGVSGMSTQKEDLQYLFKSLLPIDASNELCTKTVAAAKSDLECAAYIQAVAGQGRDLVIAEANALVEWVDTGKEEARSRRDRTGALALLKSGEITAEEA